jgi:hypothetical protein
MDVGVEVFARKINVNAKIIGPEKTVPVEFKIHHFNVINYHA